MSFKKPSEPNELYLVHCAVLICGAIVGLLSAVLVDYIPFDFSHELAMARELGIVSLTILNDYPESRDLVTYAAFVLLPVIGSLGAWLYWSRGRRAELSELLAEQAPDDPAPRRFRLIVVGAVALAFLWLSLDATMFYEPKSGWALLGEEGVHLAWAQAILEGKVYGRDFLCIYGPLMIYPLVWCMKLFGATVVTVRGYTFALEIMSRVILLLFLYRSFRNRSVMVAASLFFLAFLDGAGVGTPNSSTLRIFLAMAPLLALYASGASGRRMPLVASGVLVGVSFLFSQEAGICSVFATALYLVLEGRQYRDLPRFVREAGLLAAGFAGVVLPVLAYFFSKGALGHFFGNMYAFPKAMALGFNSLPFPSLSYLDSFLTSDYIIPYWVMGIYVVTAIVLLVRLALGVKNRELHFRAALLLFGLLVFRIALGRSDRGHFVMPSFPAFLLVFLLLDDGVKRCRHLIPSGAVLAGRKVFAGSLILSLVYLCASSEYMRHAVFALPEGLLDARKFTVQQTGVALPQLPRLGGTYVDPETARTLVGIKEALDRHAPNQKQVMFFPNEPAYYFLFDRHNPTQYIYAYLAATSAQRRDMVADLENKKIPCVVYSLTSYRLDGIPEHIQVPELTSYLQEHYTVAEDRGAFRILLRKGL